MMKCVAVGVLVFVALLEPAHAAQKSSKGKNRGSQASSSFMGKLKRAGAWAKKSFSNFQLQSTWGVPSTCSGATSSRGKRDRKPSRDSKPASSPPSTPESRRSAAPRANAAKEDVYRDYPENNLFHEDYPGSSDRYKTTQKEFPMFKTDGGRIPTVLNPAWRMGKIKSEILKFCRLREEWYKSHTKVAGGGTWKELIALANEPLRWGERPGSNHYHSHYHSQKRGLDVWFEKAKSAIDSRWDLLGKKKSGDEYGYIVGLFSVAKQRLYFDALNTYHDRIQAIHETHQSHRSSDDAAEYGIYKQGYEL